MPQFGKIVEGGVKKRNHWEAKNASRLLVIYTCVVSDRSGERMDLEPNPGRLGGIVAGGCHE